MTPANIRRLEGLLQSVKEAQQRKRKHLTIHADELPAIGMALAEALAEVDPL